MHHNDCYYADSSFDAQLLISLLVTSTVSLVGITLVLGLAFAYLVSKKSCRGKNTAANQRYSYCTLTCRRVINILIQRSVAEENMVGIELNTTDNSQNQVQVRV